MRPKQPLRAAYLYWNSSRGFTMLEALVVVAVLILLTGVLLPSLRRAQQAARLAVCAAQLGGNQKGLLLYAASHRRYLPPFAFSDPYAPDLALSGHFGGQDSTTTLSICKGAGYVNLFCVTQEDMLDPASLLCPNTDSSLIDQTSSWFSTTDQFSSYCMRFPPSEDLFTSAPRLLLSPTLSVYRRAAGGQTFPVGAHIETVPRVRLNRSYRIDGRVYDPAQSAMLADSFWYRGYQEDTDEQKVTRDIFHEDEYNVAYGNGAVRTIRDDGTIADNAVQSGQQLPSDNQAYTDQAEAIWRFFDETS